MLQNESNLGSDAIDPLSLLKDFTIAQFQYEEQKIPVDQHPKTIKLVDKQLIFEEKGKPALKLPLQTPTAWRAKVSSSTQGDQSGKISYYTLGSFWCLITYRHLKLSEYMKKTSELGVQSISALEKSAVVAYFQGVNLTTDMIDQQMRMETLLSRNENNKILTAGQRRELKMNEKLHKLIESENKMSINDFLNEREMKLENRQSVLQSQHFNFLKVLYLGYDKCSISDKQQKLEFTQKAIQNFMERDQAERRMLSQNRWLSGSNIDVFKNTLRLADINVNKSIKKKSLLEEILRKPQNSGDAQYEQQGRPIIIVPQTQIAGNICLKNVVQFLCDGKYEPPANIEDKPGDKNVLKKSFTRKIVGGTSLDSSSEQQVEVTFDVYDSVYGFTQKEWSRVVCLFTSGELYQLKDWPGPKKEGKQEDQQLKIVNLFHRVKGFYLHYQDVLEQPIVKNWNVVRLIVHRNKRHQDINLKDRIWKELEQFLRKEKFKDANF